MLLLVNAPGSGSLPDLQLGGRTWVSSRHGDLLKTPMQVVEFRAMRVFRPGRVGNASWEFCGNGELIRREWPPKSAGTPRWPNSGDPLERMRLAGLSFALNSA
jgi:hypothetical protein